MSTPTDPPGHDRNPGLPELDQPPMGCAPPPRPDPERTARRAVAGAFLALALLTGGAFVGGAVLTLSALLSAAVIAVVGHPLLPARFRGPAAAAAYACVLTVVLLA